MVFRGLNFEVIQGVPLSNTLSPLCVLQGAVTAGTLKIRNCVAIGRSCMGRDFSIFLVGLPLLILNGAFAALCWGFALKAAKNAKQTTHDLSTIAKTNEQEEVNAEQST